MVNIVCQTCSHTFTQTSHYNRHIARKRPCKRNESVQAAVIDVIKDLRIGLFQTRSYVEVKEYVDNVFNKDKSTFTSSNDEPTPIGCIEEMLEVIPSTFWDIQRKCLDPCCGNGNFHLVVADYMRNHNQPIDTILQSLRFNDLNPKRIKNVVELFGTNSNCTQLDFLKDTFDRDYDLVVMNPPYALLMEDGKRASKNHGLSIQFIQKGLDSLKEGGYLVAIVPDNWMSLADRNEFCLQLTEYQFVKLSIHVAKKWFPKVGSSFSWFVVQKLQTRIPYTIEYLHKSIIRTSIVPSSLRSYIPLWYSAITHNIFEKTVDCGREAYIVETSSDLHRYTKRSIIQDTESTEFCNRLIHTPTQTAWANRPHKFQDGWKVFISTTNTYGVFVDNCGMTQSIAFIRTESQEEANQIKKILEHPLFVFINNACRYGNFNNIRVLQKFPKVKSDPYVEFEITADEIRYIESHSR
jgi:SAM-dependent methyltransferase